MLNRERVKLSDQHRGIKDMRKPPDAVVIVDGQYEDTAIKEATSMGIPVVDDEFSPKILRVEPGTTVIWESGGANNHNVIASDGSLLCSLG